MDFELTKITKNNLNILKNLFQLYIHDISKELTWETDKDGLFFAYSLEEWLDNKDNFGFLIYVGHNLAGFVMIDKEFKVLGTTDALNLSEIFVLNSYKNKGIEKKLLTKYLNLTKDRGRLDPFHVATLLLNFGIIY